MAISMRRSDLLSFLFDDFGSLLGGREALVVCDKVEDRGGGPLTQRHPRGILIFALQLLRMNIN
jgi:hypothetical protein